MDKQELMTKALTRVKTDYNTLKEEWLTKGAKYLIDYAYKIAHENEAYVFLECELDDINECRYDEQELETIINHKGNIMERVFDEWLKYDNECINYFYWGDLYEIIGEALFRKENR